MVQIGAPDRFEWNHVVHGEAELDHTLNSDQGAAQERPR